MKKILFSDRFGLTEAVLEGRKTMTRRIIQDKDHLYEDIRCMKFSHLNDYGNAVMRSATGFAELLPNYRIGEVVAVAQAYHTLNKAGFVAPEWCEHTCEDSPGYSNKMFVRADLMPYQIRITNVRVERLQDLSDEDCIWEGIVKVLGLYGCEGLCERGDQLYFSTPRAAFAALIDKVSGRGTWDSDPWVFVYEFELINR